MPIYEFRCNDCGRIISVFQRGITASAVSLCPHCGGRNLSRLISPFAVLRSSQAVDDSLADLDSIDENDPGSVARWARRMKSEGFGQDLGPEFDEMVGRMEAGESAPDLGAEGFDEDLE